MSRKKGNCRRYIGRVLNIKARHSAINPEEIYSAFKDAKKGSKVLLGLTGHDFRDLSHEIEYAYNLIKNTSKDFHIPFYFRSTPNGFIDTLDLKSTTNLEGLLNEKILLLNGSSE